MRESPRGQPLPWSGIVGVRPMTPPGMNSGSSMADKVAPATGTLRDLLRRWPLNMTSRT